MNPSPLSSQVAGNAPISKVANAGYIGAIATVAIWALKTYAHTEIPPEVAAATVLILTGFVGYVTPLRSREIK